MLWGTLWYPGLAAVFPMWQPKHPPACRKRAHERWWGTPVLFPKKLGKKIRTCPKMNRYVALCSKGMQRGCGGMDGESKNFWKGRHNDLIEQRSFLKPHWLCIAPVKVFELLHWDLQGCADGAKCYAAQENLLWRTLVDLSQGMLGWDMMRHDETWWDWLIQDIDHCGADTYCCAPVTQTYGSQFGES